MGAPALGQSSLEQSIEVRWVDNSNSTNKSGLNRALKQIVEQLSLGDDEDDDYIHQAQPFDFITNIEAPDRQRDASRNVSGTRTFILKLNIHEIKILYMFYSSNL